MLRLLVVEDSMADFRLLTKAWERSPHPPKVAHALTAEAALEQLATFRPDLILLDLKLPGMDGHDFLDRVKAHAAWRTIPVVVLSTSAADRDVRLAYERQASAYFQKPADFVELVALLEGITAYWGRARLARD